MQKLKDKKRIIILGCSGSGKSTLSKELGALLNINVTHLDKLYYKPNWIEEDKEVFKNKQLEIIAEDAWIIDGNYRKTLDLRLQRCDLVIYLDYNKLTSMHGVLKRYRQYKHKQRDTIATGCFEKLDKSFLRWVWRFKKDAKPLIMEMIAKYDHYDYLVFKNRRALNKWLENEKQNY